MAPEKNSKTATRNWQSLGLPPWELEAVSSLGYQTPTPVQNSAIPLFLANADVVVEAPTGSGKTIAFLLPLCAKILRNEVSKRHHIDAIIVSPTRELASQTHSVLTSLLAFHPQSAAVLPYQKGSERRPATAEPAIIPQLVVGGSKKAAEDLSTFLRLIPNVLVATPGRLAVLLASDHVHSSSCEILVLDEADRILDLGFSPDLKRIIGFIPKQRRTGLFSASVNEALGEIIKVNLRNPKRVVVRVKSLKDGHTIEEKKTPASLSVSYFELPASHKWPAMVKLLETSEPRPHRVIVFLSSGQSVKYWANILPSLLPEGWSVIGLQGKMEPRPRENAFHKFVSSASPSILITTDLASRGLDIPAVDLVLNIDPPTDPKTFIHRIGRAGRAGRRGTAITFLLPGPELDFVPFMASRAVPMAPLSHPPIAISLSDAAAATATIRARALADREVYQLSQRAFVSFVRSYQENALSKSIFRVQDLDWSDQARAWGLLRLPRMPELRDAGVDRALGLGVDVEGIRYRDSAKEKKRQVELAEAAAAAAEGRDAAPGGKKKEEGKRRVNEAWSNKLDRDDGKVARREKKLRKREAERTAGMTEREREDKKELDELVAEVRRWNQVKSSGGGGEEEFVGFED